MPIIITLDCAGNIINCEGEIEGGNECSWGISKPVACHDVYLCNGIPFDADNEPIRATDIIIRNPVPNSCAYNYRCNACNHTGNVYNHKKPLKLNLGQSESMYHSRLATKNAMCSSGCLAFVSNQSDRVVAGRSVPVKIRRNLSGPGQTGAGGHGVDVKHNSYARYINKLKRNNRLL